MPARSAAWPAQLLPVFTGAITVEYTSLTRNGAPFTTPLTPFADMDAGALDVSTGLTYPAKAERARRNPKVCLLFADPVGSEMADPPVVLVQGLATVRDADLQANTDRYVRSILAKTPAAFRGQPRFLQRRLDWYVARIWIKVTPLRMWWWPSRALAEDPREWVAPASTIAPPSDAAPPGIPPSAWLEPPGDWREPADRAVERLGQVDLSWVGADGFPASVPVPASRSEAGFHLNLGRHGFVAPEGRACLTFHTHTAAFTSQENRTFVGTVSTAADEADFHVERLLADVSLTGNKLRMTLGFLAKGRRLAPRLQSEASRRGQAVPAIRLPS
jgi:hypothetical protein